ncbi:ABC transporter ATP-binding protein [Nakamurella lactea]|uniref:ABC transporter ATP-binding protein n=1 Tax=Nakamurella lactea TaxID=459515 RepID=UPI00055DFE86|nr:ABC transporter ATP-binding protein [Nakamurella lactea]
MTTETLLELEHVTKAFKRRGTSEQVLAVDQVSLTVRAGESVALVGESGSGKSTLARIALGLELPDAGSVVLTGHELSTLRGKQLRSVRRRMQPIFQDAGASFNPRRSVRAAMFQGLRHLGSDDERQARAVDLLDRVGLRPGESFLHRLPHELSGGQRQRLAIARAIASDPVLIVADEPLSGADVSVRGQVMNLLVDLQKERGIAYLMITHDISLARSFADRVAVMHHGSVVEQGSTDDVLSEPKDDYTRLLVRAVPELNGPMPSRAYLT